MSLVRHSYMKKGARLSRSPFQRNPDADRPRRTYGGLKRAGRTD